MDDPLRQNPQNPLTAVGASRLLVVAPNWLGDAVMALPALADIRRASPAVVLAVAARPSIAPLFEMAEGIEEILTLPSGGSLWEDGPAPLRAGAFDVALLLPNSFHAAYLVWRAGIRQRWGYATDCRGRLLTKRVSPPRRVHQAAFYQQLVRDLGFPTGAMEARLEAPPSARERAAGLLRAGGWDGAAPFMVLAPGAAYGSAKRWPAASFAAVATALGKESVVVLTGSTADLPAGRECLEGVAPGVRVINLIGATNLKTLAGLLSLSRGLISNDSGAMHLAAALSVPVTALFGPTDEEATHPIGRAPSVILTHAVWCRPCLLRECPLDHRCMRGITVDSVVAAARRAS